MSNNLKIDTGAIQSTADTIHAQNEQLFAILTKSKDTVHSLKGAWQGAAADATIKAYDSFAGKYFEQYRDMLNEYVKFLNDAAAAGYNETEIKITRKADDI